MATDPGTAALGAVDESQGTISTQGYHSGAGLKSLRRLAFPGDDCHIAVMFVALLTLLSVGPGPLPNAKELALGRLTGLDREMGGLLDAYLLAVPECPPMEDTPVRCWGMEAAGLRAEVTRRSALWVLWYMPDVETRSALKHYLAACDSYLSECGATIRAYCRGELPGAAEAVDLEDSLLQVDSVWSERGAELFDLLEERHWP